MKPTRLFLTWLAVWSVLVGAAVTLAIVYARPAERVAAVEGQ